MTSLARILVCMVTAFISGGLGLALGAIFLPLVFPLSLENPSRVENTVVTLMFVAILLFAAAGIALCWRITARWSK